MKRKAGRPNKFTDEFYKQMYKEHENFSLSQMAYNHAVSTSTIIRWVRKGKEITNEKA